MRHHFRHPQAMFNKGSLFYSHCVITGLLSSADLANDAPNISELALPTTHPTTSPFHAQWSLPVTFLRHARPQIVMQ
jgi:hypothetical protein